MTGDDDDDTEEEDIDTETDTSNVIVLSGIQPRVDTDPRIAAQPKSAEVIDLTSYDPETAARVAELTNQVNIRHGKTDTAIAVAQQWYDNGKDLCEIKEKVGHGKFGQHVKEHCVFSYSTALNYMRVYRAVETGKTKIATIAKMGLVAALYAVKEQVDPIAREQKKLNRSFGTFRSQDRQARFIAEWDSIEQEVIKDSGLFEKMDWPEPAQVAETLLLEWTHDRQETTKRPLKQIAYVWRRDQDRFKVIVIQFGDEVYWATASGILNYWQSVLPWLREYATKTGAGGHYTLLLRDPARVTMLEHFAETILLKRSDEPLI